MDSISRNIFWGLVIKPGKRYETEVREAFRVTKACIEPTSSKEGKITSVLVECDNNEEFIIANLNLKSFNESLDIAFNEGEKICFKVEGPGTVHLTGNLLEDSPPGDIYDMETDSDDVEESEVEEEAVEPSQKRKKDLVNGVGKAKKAKMEEGDTTVETTLGDLDDTDNFAEEEDSEDEDDDDDDDDDDDEEDDSGEEDTSMADTTAATEGSDDSEDDSDEEEEEKEKEVKKDKEEKPVNGDVSVTSKGDKKPEKVEETPKEDADTQKEGAVPKTPKDKTPKPESKTPKPEDKSTKQEAKPPKQEAKTPKVEAKLPKEEGKAPKTPKQEAKTPKQEAKTPKQDAKTPKQDAKTPKVEAKPPKEEGKAPKSGKEAETPGKTPKKTLKGGIQVEEVKEGTGPECKPGNMVGMYYEGRLKSNNKKFDGLNGGKPFKFKLGAGQVIKGWDIGVLGMKVGGKRKLIIPPKLGYGADGAPPDIPPNSTLVFDIECKFVK